MLPLLCLGCILLPVLQDPQSPPKAKPALAPIAERTAALEKQARELSQLQKELGLESERVVQANDRFRATLEEFLAEPAQVEWVHAARAIQVLWETECIPGCAQVCELALKRFEPTAELYAQLGMCKLEMAKHAVRNVDCRLFANEAAEAFLASRKRGDLEPAHVLLHQALATACRNTEALAEWDALCADPRYSEQFAGMVHHIRGLYLLLGDRAGEAVVELTGPGMAKEEPFRGDRVDLVRALALAGRHEEAVAKAREAWREVPKDYHLTLLIDVLGYTGAFDEALHLLKANPPKPAHGSEQPDGDVKKSRAVLEYLLGLRGSRPADLRKRLVELLGYQVKVGSADGLLIHEGGAEPANMNTTPLAVGCHVLQQPTSACTWVDELLFVVCVEEARTTKTNALGQQLMLRILPAADVALVTGKDALPKARRAFASLRMMEYAEGVLTATRLLGK